MDAADYGILSHYRLIEKIGEGGMGVVWKALDTTLDRLVALKVLAEPLARDRSFLERFEREARSVAALNHPNIVTIYSIEREGPVRFLTMELVRGRPLSAILPEAGLPLPRFHEIACPLLEAVAAAHDRGIAHLDLKPANVVVGDEGAVKVLDFGLARRTAAAGGGSDPPPRVPPPGAGSQVSGTLPYMSPEQLRGERPDLRSDLFSIGVVLWEMLAGRRPFDGAGSDTIAAALLNWDPPLLNDVRPGVPRALARLVRQCMEKDPGRRPASARLVATELMAIRRAAESQRPAGARSLAVLPFADESDAGDQSHLGDGMAEELIHALAAVPGLKVASRSTSFRFRGSARPAREIGLDLGVGALLEGAVRREGERILVRAELTGAADGLCVWSGRFEGDRRDVFGIQEGIARAIVEALEVDLHPEARDALRRPVTADPEVYDLYLRGRQFFHRYGKRSILVALEQFARAAERDPDYAPAHAGIAECHAFLYMHVSRNDAHRRAADEASRRALESAPRLAQAHASRGMVHSLFGRHADAGREFETASRLDPDLFETAYFRARDEFAQGNLERAAACYERAMELRPDDHQSPLLVAQIYDDLGRPDEARTVRLRGVARAEAHLAFHPDDVRALYMAANGLVALGERERGLAWAQRAAELEPDDSMTLYNVACVRSLAGLVEPGLDALERAIEAGLVHREWIESDSNLDALRGHPRFASLLARAAGSAPARV